MTPSVLPKYCHLRPGMVLRLVFITCSSSLLMPCTSGSPFAVGGALPDRHPVLALVFAITTDNDIVTSRIHQSINHCFTQLRINDGGQLRRFSMIAILRSCPSISDLLHDIPLVVYIDIPSYSPLLISAKCTMNKFTSCRSSSFSVVRCYTYAVVRCPSG